MIKLQHYPVLQSLLWDQPDATEINDKDAFAYYEKRWRYVDETQLTGVERALIARLTEEQGNGHFLAAG